MAAVQAAINGRAAKAFLLFIDGCCGAPNVSYLLAAVQNTTTSRHCRRHQQEQPDCRAAQHRIALRHGRLHDAGPVQRRLGHLPRQRADRQRAVPDQWGTVASRGYTGLFGKNVELHIYSDNDGNAFTKISYYKKEFKIFKYFFSNIIVHYNMKNKDFGFPIGDIDKVDCELY